MSFGNLHTYARIHLKTGGFSGRAQLHGDSQLWNPKLHNHHHESAPPVHIRKNMNSVCLLPFYFLNFLSNNNLLCTCTSSYGLLPSGSPIKLCIYFSPMRAVYPTHFILLALIILVTRSDGYKVSIIFKISWINFTLFQRMAAHNHQSGNIWLHACAMAYMWLGLSSVVAAHAENNRESATDMGSILEIINTQEVERLLAARKENISREERRYLGQNALDDIEISEQEDNVSEKDSEYDFRQQLNNSGARKFVSRQMGASHKTHTVGLESLLKKNNQSFPQSSHDILAELGGYSGDKLLKSGKNALMVTKKEYLKRDWCKTEPLVQRIREDGCLTRTVINRFCYGQCNSFYIPRNPRRRRSGRRESEEEEEEESDAPAFKSCAFCKPKKSSWITVTLNCPSMSPQIRKRRVLRIKQCKCITEVFNWREITNEKLL